MLLTIYFTHHPSSGRADPTTLELELPVSALSIHEHWARRSVNICSVMKEGGGRVYLSASLTKANKKLFLCF